MRKVRGIYAFAFCALFLTEICIALFVRDHFIRPYVGDALVTILLCCLCRTVIPRDFSALPVCVFVFAALVETAQFFDIVKWMGLENSTIISTVVGRTFSWGDVICYAAGCLAFWLVERAAYAVGKKKTAQL